MTAKTDAQAQRSNTDYSRRAAFLDRDNFYIQSPPGFAAHAFLAERERALDPRGPTGYIALDYRNALGTEWPATTPLMLARYGRVRARDSLASRFYASAEMYYVISGAGESRNRQDAIRWRAGDVFCFPGGEKTVHTAGEENALLWCVTNEPLLAFDGLAPRADARLVAPVHYLAEDIDANLARTQAAEAAKGGASNGNGVFMFSSTGCVERRRLPFPSLTLAMNSLAPGNAQRPHRHNAVALTLVLEAEACHSLIDGARHDWLEHAALITPPGQMHSHYNQGGKLARLLIAQDSGMHYYCRTPGFSHT